MEPLNAENFLNNLGKRADKQKHYKWNSQGGALLLMRKFMAAGDFRKI